MKILKLLIYSNFVVSISVGALTAACAKVLGTTHPEAMGYAAFFSTFFIYNIQRILRLKGIHEDSSDRLKWIKRNALRLLLASLLSIIGCLVVYFFILGVEIDFWFLAFSAVFGILYAFEFTPKVEGLRDIPYIKIYLIAILWAMVTVFWPFIRDMSHPFPIWLILSVFFYILACTVPFDIRDMFYDDHQKKTIPQLFGQRGAQLVALIFLGISALALFLGFNHVIYQVWFYVSYGILILLILYSNHRRSEMYFSGIIDFWIVSYAICIYLL